MVREKGKKAGSNKTVLQEHKNQLRVNIPLVIKGIMGWKGGDTVSIEPKKEDGSILISKVGDDGGEKD